ncbi:MAG: J domain-containing protein [Acidobacteriota bacterium]
MSLYSLLGLSSSATGAEIERAYRRLARRFHPGINPGDRAAEQMYGQIQEAYRVLGSPELRREYDRGASMPAARIEATAAAFEGFDFTAPAEGASAATFAELFADVFQQAARDAVSPIRGADVSMSVTVPFANAMRGGVVTVSVTRQERCPTCHGGGRIARVETVCPACRGDGAQRWARGHMVFTKSCEACGGQGRLASEPCRPCHGAGVVPRTEVLTVPVPAGLESGTRIAVPGHGHAGAGGGASGDLYVTVDVPSHPFFSRVGRDLHVTVPVAVHEAALGAVVDIPGLDGPLRIRIPAGAGSGQPLRLRGAGVGSGAPGSRSEDAGDLVVTLHVVLPPQLDDRSRELLREFGRLNAGDVRRGWFEPLSADAKA